MEFSDKVTNVIDDRGLTETKPGATVRDLHDDSSSGEHERPQEERTSSRSTKRARRETQKFDPTMTENRDQLLLQKALENSRKETKRVTVEVPFAPTFRPTVEEFRCPLKYILSIREEAEEYGICKIVPPEGWNPELAVDLNDNTIPMSTKKQVVHTLQEGKGFPDGCKYTLQSYRKMADAFEAKYDKMHYEDKKPDLAQLRKDYWDMVETSGGTKKATVEYANDIDTTRYGSGFPRLEGGIKNSGNEVDDCTDMFSEDYYRRTGWNLNNIASADGSVLKHLETQINGINVPWLYCGMRFASFCWHNEDNYLYSINYSHCGAVKQWYGVPGDQAKNFEKNSRDSLFESFEDNPDLLHHMTTQISPSLLIRKNVPVCQLTQEPKTFILTFPKAFHAGFSYGFNVGEAVNFATPDWVVKGSEAEERYREFSRPSVFSHVRLLFTLVEHIHEFDVAHRRPLLELINGVVREELYFRNEWHKLDIRDASEFGVSLPQNDFTVIDKKVMDYDDMRVCSKCKSVCIFTAIACECSESRVCCLRHTANSVCSCTIKRRYIISWATNWELENVQAKVRHLLVKN